MSHASHRSKPGKPCATRVFQTEKSPIFGIGLHFGLQIPKSILKHPSPQAPMPVWWNWQTPGTQNYVRLMSSETRKHLKYKVFRKRKIPRNRHRPPNRPPNLKSRSNPCPASIYAGVMELADVLDSKSNGLITRAGSTPAAGTIRKSRKP